jgi:hypothetical protein
MNQISDQTTADHKVACAAGQTHAVSHRLTGLILYLHLCFTSDTGEPSFAPWAALCKTSLGLQLTCACRSCFSRPVFEFLEVLRRPACDALLSHFHAAQPLPPGLNLIKTWREHWDRCTDTRPLWISYDHV